MVNAFEEGYYFFRDYCLIDFAARAGQNYGDIRLEYIDSIRQEIQNLEDSINAFKGFETSVEQLKGNVAEVYHAGTFNIDAAIKGSLHRAKVLNSHELASVDIETNFDVNYGVKYYGSAEATARQQLKSWEQVLHQAIKNKNYNDILEFFESDRHDIHESIYSGQLRLVPADQFKEITKILQQKLATESVRRPELVPNIQETLDALTDRIKDNQGVESYPLSVKEAETLARLGKEGLFSAEEQGIIAPNLFSLDDIIKESLDAGKQAALYSLVLKLGPEIYKAISYFIKNGNISKEELEIIGTVLFSESAESFIRGALTAGLSASVRMGLLGKSAKDISLETLSQTVLLVFYTIKDSYKLSRGELKPSEMMFNLIKRTYILKLSSVGVGIGQAYIPIPGVGLLLGSLIGSVIGSITYEFGYKQLIGFCVESGFTFFGLVEQDYRLSDDVLDELGLDSFELDNFEINTFELDTFAADSFDIDSFEVDSFMPRLLRRGVIEINKVGYNLY